MIENSLYFKHNRETIMHQPKSLNRIICLLCIILLIETLEILGNSNKTTFGQSEHGKNKLFSA